MAKNTKKIFPDLEMAKAKASADIALATARLNKELAKLHVIETASLAVGVDLLEFGNNWGKVAKILRESGVTEEKLKTLRVLYGKAKK